MQAVLFSSTDTGVGPSSETTPVFPRGRNTRSVTNRLAVDRSSSTRASPCQKHQPRTTSGCPLGQTIASVLQDQWHHKSYLVGLSPDDGFQMAIPIHNVDFSFLLIWISDYCVNAVDTRSILFYKPTWCDKARTSHGLLEPSLAKKVCDLSRT